MTMPLKTVFYTIEKTIKEYRKFSQRNLIKKEKHITVDQALVLNILKEQPGLTQKEIAGLLYKDVAAMTRMIEGMVKKGILKKLPYPDDKRRSLIQPTDRGEAILEKIIPVVLRNRELALQGMTEEEVHTLNTLLNKILTNLNRNS